MSSPSGREMSAMQMNKSRISSPDNTSFTPSSAEETKDNKQPSAVTARAQFNW